MTTSVLTTAQATDTEAYRATPYFSVSLSKLAVMSICTFGIYELYWCYKNWDAERKRKKEELSAFWRAFFAPLWGFSLFGRVQRETALHRVPATWSATALGLTFLILMGLWRLPDPYWLVSLFSFAPLLIVQRAVNNLNSSIIPEAPPNDKYSGRNVAAIVAGGLLLLLAIWGTFLPAEAMAHNFPAVAA